MFFKKQILTILLPIPFNELPCPPLPGPPNSVPRSTEGGLRIPGRIKVGAEDIGGGTELISGFVTLCPLMIQPDTDLQ